MIDDDDDDATDTFVGSPVSVVCIVCIDSLVHTFPEDGCII